MINWFAGKRVAVVGSRGWPDLRLVSEFVGCWLVKAEKLISGAADGVDRTAAYAARTKGIPVVEHAVEEVPGNIANPEKFRNTTIVNEAQVVVAFWHKRSGGTKDVIDKARLYGKPLIVVELP
jgi:hypothetical protein